MTVLQYFVIGFILCVVFLVLYIIDRKKDCIGIIDALDIDDETSLGLFLFVTLILWPLELIILAFIGMLYLLYLLCTGIGSLLFWIISKIVKEKK
jgi:hypothetical protein